jgi:SmpA/OmlA family protein
MAQGIRLIPEAALSVGYGEEYEQFKKVRPGMTEQQVREHLGQPDHVVSSNRELAPIAEPYGGPSVPITYRAYVYISKSHLMCVISFSRQRRVEAIDFGHS